MPSFVRTTILVFVSSLLVSVPPIARAQSPIEIIEQEATYLFNDWMHFFVRFESSENLNEGYVFYQLDGSERIWVYEGELSEDQIFEVNVDLASINVPKAFTMVSYWFRFGSDYGDFFESQRYSFYYDDNRYVWQTLEQGPFTLRWHNGDQAFADAILAAADQAVVRTQSLLPLPAPTQINFQVYDNVNDVQLVLDSAGYSWLAGHTDPQLNLVLLSLPPGAQQSLEIERAVPHEVAHLILYQALGAEAYGQLPVWLDEGIASAAEIYSDPLRAELLRVAYGSNALIPFYTLCETFPQDTTSARLAYAQSASFVRYLHDEYNSIGLSILVDAYAHNPDCLGAPLESFGKDLLALDSDWRQATFAAPSELVAWVQALPWQTILVSAVVAIIIGTLIRRMGRIK